ncbi:hypothetical protein KSC_020020 [Ktedonobacter sp. SOSP1-52]|uniref:hypothetical protein n=1 Tax=Ktedonobacter sp. SOSP1-52 TaxID=2778366 RepID=UPI001915468E|nr:hypothetical protein [Ktedonobacter sp. SOSP1-52]GHO63110.1 hypothetical protein KSC_020020 [Ktedonobacter sp. SOSP1-52]
MSGYRFSLRLPILAQRHDFWKFWAGQTISNFGSSFTVFAWPLLVYGLTEFVARTGQYAEVRRIGQ